MAVIRFDVTEWVKYIDAVEEVGRQDIQKQRELLQSIGTRYVNAIRTKMNAQDINFLNTYYNSLKVDNRQLGNKTPKLSIVIQPQGANANRLPIYWKTIEFGSRPNPNVPKGRIINWASKKYGNPALGAVVAERIKTQGLTPRPVLDDIFVISPDGNLMDITAFAKSIAEQQGQIFLKELEIVYTTFVRRGRAITQQRGPGGRFGKLISIV